MTGQSLATAELRTRRRALLGLHARIQQVLLLGSVLVLALTGLPQRFDSLGISRWIIDSAGGIEVLRSIHHGAGAVLIVAAIYHVALVLFAVLANRDLRPLSMIPDARDYGEAIATVLYLVGLSRRRPVLREPTYFQKFDYWVLAWVLAVMGVTGVTRLFPASMTRLVSGDAVAAALRTHSEVAVLAVVWVAVVHVGYVMLMSLPTNQSGQPTEAPQTNPGGSVESRG